LGLNTGELESSSIHPLMKPIGALTYAGRNKMIYFRFCLVR